MARFFSGYIEGRAISDDALLDWKETQYYFDVFYQNSSESHITIHISKSLIDDPKYLFRKLEELIESNKGQFVFNGTISYAGISEDLLIESPSSIGTTQPGAIRSGEFHVLNNETLWTKLSRKNIFRRDVDVLKDETACFNSARSLLEKLERLLMEDNASLNEYLLDHLKDVCDKIEDGKINPYNEVYNGDDT
jgi:hypothetical protein